MSYNSKYEGSEVESLLDKVNDMGEIPTKVSQLENDEGYITSHQDISHLATKDDLQSKADDASVVHKTGDETISGAKTFNSGVNFLGNGDSNAVTLSTNTRINVNGTNHTVLGFASGSFYISHGNYNLNVRGKASRPAYNGSDMALLSDVNVKQDKITDLQTIREGAAKGATAIQSHQDISGKLDKTEAASTYLSKTEASSTYLGKTAKAADATKADSATKATQDGNGNNIVNTYATKDELNGKGTYSKPSTGIPKSDLASAVQTSLGKADTALQSYTEQYKGTVTGIKVNGSTKTPSSGTVDIGNVVTGVKINGSTKSPSSGTVDLGTVITAHQDISGKQDKLVSGTNIKTINGQSLLGGGNITISEGGGSSSGGSGAYAEVNHGTNDTTFALTPNTFHVWDEVASLDLSFVDEQTGVANEYLFQFTSGATATTLTLPDVKWANDAAPTIAENMIYQVSVLKGLASVLEFGNKHQLIENKGTYNAGSMMSGATLTFEYPVASDLTIELEYHKTGNVVILTGETSVKIDWNEPSPPIIASITPIEDSIYKYIII